jgi:hypothetical protein
MFNQINIGALIAIDAIEKRPISDSIVLIISAMTNDAGTLNDPNADNN